MKIFNSDIKIIGDDEGFIILECPYCKSEFKLSADDLQANGDIYFEIFCPYCGLSKEIKNFYTREIKSKTTRAKREKNKNIIKEQDKKPSDNNIRLSSSKSLDLSFSSMEREIDKNQNKDFYQIKMDNKKLENVNIDRLKDKDLKEISYKCSICNSSEKLLSDGKTVLYCAYCGVNL
ncbi:MAG: hypothetical protein SPD90_05890 [Intestinibacter sp.]|uniref:hypothetical protein n=1 Tax=Intestinibacter sp. TaxID=1965304 RepID=UPI002A7EEE78|nr:hypothetical protein [Intestinibacter sp.]MDY4574569.1 hypothetical protein [Intestinibacter sp.]